MLDGARTLGAKILVSGGGRCNVTHDVVDETSYCGSSPHAIRKVLRRFGVDEVVAFFREQSVDMKREPTGKLFPKSDRGRDVLDALLRAAHAAGAQVRHPCAVASIERRDEGFVLKGGWGELAARRVILATGGRSLPKSGSDGSGFALARAVGHSIAPVFPSLVPLVAHPDSFVRQLRGITVEATLEVRSATGKRLASVTGSTLLTHFGLSGPAPLDVSRHLLAARRDDPGASLVASWLPGESLESIDAALRELRGETPGHWLARRCPERLAQALCREARVAPSLPGGDLSREARRALTVAIGGMVVPIVSDRGWDFAETTAGGVPLAEVRLDTMESRVCPGLHLAGEILDVDGRIGGYSFQWAWSSGHVAGISA